MIIGKRIQGEEENIYMDKDLRRFDDDIRIRDISNIINEIGEDIKYERIMENMRKAKEEIERIEYIKYLYERIHNGDYDIYIEEGRDIEYIS